MRKTNFANNEYYHIYNRGVDKRDVFLNEYDFERFLKSVYEFNTVSPTGGLHQISFKRKNLPLSVPNAKSENLVEIIGYCINKNHYHFILKQLIDNGISKFMQKLGQGYAMYFNEKYKRNGTLFQGRFKSSHISSNEYLLHLSVYVNLNYEVHKLSVPNAKSSWREYVEGLNGLCEKNIILSQFNNADQYKIFAENALSSILQRRDMDKLRIE